MLLTDLGVRLDASLAFGDGLSAAFTAFFPIRTATRVIAFKLRLNARRPTKLKLRRATAAPTSQNLHRLASGGSLLGCLDIQAPVWRLK